jgi:hypothetical protein
VLRPMNGEDLLCFYSSAPPPGFAGHLPMNGEDVLRPMNGEDVLCFCSS